MQYEWDEEKRQVNLAKHGVDFRDVHLFTWEEAAITQDLRQDYGEPRFVAYGFCCESFMVLAFTLRNERIRIISYRKANSRERRKYAPV